MLHHSPSRARDDLHNQKVPLYFAQMVVNLQYQPRPSVLLTRKTSAVKLLAILAPRVERRPPLLVLKQVVSLDQKRRRLLARSVL
jgi:hypothetical protein